MSARPCRRSKSRSMPISGDRCTTRYESAGRRRCSPHRSTVTAPALWPDARQQATLDLARSATRCCSKLTATRCRSKPLDRCLAGSPDEKVSVDPRSCRRTADRRYAAGRSRERTTVTPSRRSPSTNAAACEPAGHQPAGHEQQPAASTTRWRRTHRTRTRPEHKAVTAPPTTRRPRLMAASRTTITRRKDRRWACCGWARSRRATSYIDGKDIGQQTPLSGVRDRGRRPQDHADQQRVRDQRVVYSRRRRGHQSNDQDRGLHGSPAEAVARARCATSASRGTLPRRAFRVESSDAARSSRSNAQGAQT